MSGGAELGMVMEGIASATVAPAGEEPLLHPGEAVLLGLGVLLTIAMTIFFIFILRMAHRDSLADDEPDSENG